MGLIAEETAREPAYRVLGVSTDASAHAIKQANRKLVKRWHPDFYKAGTTSEASEMTRLINEAYSAIGHAPLRYQSRVSSEANYQREKSASRATNTATDETRGPRLDKSEFWTRFVCGALFGLFVAAYATVSALSDAANLSVSGWLIGLVLVAAVFGFLSARYEDKFWHSILVRWFCWIF